RRPNRRRYKGRPAPAGLPFRPVLRGHLDGTRRGRHPLVARVYAVVDDSLSRHLLGDSIEVFVRREDAEHFIEEIEAMIRSSRGSYGSRSGSSDAGALELAHSSPV